MSDYPMLISNKLHSFRNFVVQRYSFFLKHRQNRSKTFLKHRQNRSKTFLKHRQNRSKTFLKHRQQTAKLPHNWSVVPVLLFVVPVAPKCCSGAAGVLFRCYRSFIPVLPEFYYSSAGISIIRSFQTSYCSLTFLVDYFQS